MEIVFCRGYNPKGMRLENSVKKLTVNQFLNDLHMCDDVDKFDALILVDCHVTAIKGGVCYDTWDCGRYKCQLLIIKEGNNDCVYCEVIE